MTSNRVNEHNLRKTALITGASSGIGYELAKLFAKDGFNLVLVARNADKLNQIASELRDQFNVSIKSIPKDLSVSTAPDEIFAAVKKDLIQIDVLVNNAGFNVYGPFFETDLIKEREMIQVNMVSLTHLTKLFLYEMIKRRYGKILNVASTAAFQPGPFGAVYYATKAYVLYFTEAIANELRGSGVNITVLCPGPTKTEFQKRARMKNSRLTRSKLMNAEVVAKAGYYGLMKGKSIVIPGMKNKILVLSVRLVPSVVSLK